MKYYRMLGKKCCWIHLLTPLFTNSFFGSNFIINLLISIIIKPKNETASILIISSELKATVLNTPCRGAQNTTKACIVIDRIIAPNNHRFENGFNLLNEGNNDLLLNTANISNMTNVVKAIVLALFKSISLY